MSKRADSAVDRTRFFISLAVFALTLGVVAFSIFNRPTDRPVIPTPAQIMPLDPTVAASVQNAEALALDADSLAMVAEISTQVEACPDYGPERRSQMNQHLTWLRAPISIPSDILMAIGSNPMGRLALGMATYTAVEWRLLEQPAESCLLLIGRLVNTLVVRLGEAPDPAFGES
jgi:hypothetical protein